MKPQPETEEEVWAPLTPEQIDDAVVRIVRQITFHHQGHALEAMAHWELLCATLEPGSVKRGQADLITKLSYQRLVRQGIY